MSNKCTCDNCDNNRPHDCTCEPGGNAATPNDYLPEGWIAADTSDPGDDRPNPLDAPTPEELILLEARFRRASWMMSEAAGGFDKWAQAYMAAAKAMARLVKLMAKEAADEDA